MRYFRTSGTTALLVRYYRPAGAVLPRLRYYRSLELYSGPSVNCTPAVGGASTLAELDAIIMVTN